MSYDSVHHYLEYNTQQQQQYNQHLSNLRQEFLSNMKEDKFDDSTKVEDFDCIKTIGTGAYGKVYLVRHKALGHYHAMKALEKKDVVKHEQIQYVLFEKKILSCVNFPFIVSLDYCFKDNVYVYFVMPLVSGGELFTHLSRMGSFNEQLSKFYASQIVLAFEYLHYCGIIFRDLKPENILVEKTGYLKLADFGFSKYIGSGNRAYTICGTPEYLAPEIINNSGYDYAVDWWTLGVLIFEMSVGQPPFIESEPIKLYEKINSGKYICPPTMSKECRLILKGLLHVEPSKRLGSLNSKIFDIKNSPYFSGIYWLAILNKRIEPPFSPTFTSSELDCSNFVDFPESILKKSPQCLYEREFADF